MPPIQGCRPDSLIIIGVITALEPQLVEYMPALCDLQSNANEIVRTLELNFDPRKEIEARKELEKKATELASNEQTETNLVLIDLDTEYLNKIREETKT
jgi:hypothetical protein